MEIEAFFRSSTLFFVESCPIRRMDGFALVANSIPNPRRDYDDARNRSHFPQKRRRYFGG